MSSNIPKQRSEIKKASKRCPQAKARKCKERTPVSRRGMEVHEVVPEVGVRGNLHLGLGCHTRTHHGSMLPTLNRLSKHLWGLNTTHLLWSYRNRCLGDQPACRAPALGKEAAPTAGSHSAGKRHGDGLPMTLGQEEKAACHTVSTEREQGSLESREWDIHHLCALSQPLNHIVLGRKR